MVGWKHWSLLFFTRQSCSPEDSSVGTALKHRGVYIAILSVLALELMIVTFPTTAGCCVLRKQKGKAEEWRVSWNSLHYLSIARISVRFEEQSYAFCDSVLGLWWDLPEVKVLWQPRRACVVCSEEDMVLSLKSGKPWGQNLNAKHWALLSAALSFPLQCWNSPRFFTEPTSCHCGFDIWLWHVPATQQVLLTSLVLLSRPAGLSRQNLTLHCPPMLSAPVVTGSCDGSWRPCGQFFSFIGTACES